MRRTTLTRRRTRRAVAVAALLPVLALSACSDDSGDDDGKASKDPSASASPGDDQGENGGENDDANGGATEGGTGGETGGNGGNGEDSGVPPLSQAQLDRAALTTGDLPGWEVDTNEGENDDAPMGTEPETCRPIADVMGPTPVRERTAEVQTLAYTEKGQLVPILLSAHAPGDAEKVLSELREAVARCGSFTGTEEGEKPEKMQAAASSEQLSVGDESFTFDLTSPGEDGQLARITVMRTGGNTTTFIGTDFKTGTPQTIDKALVEKQHDKLVAAAGS